MVIRNPVAAGYFYPASPQTLLQEVEGFLGKGRNPAAASLPSRELWGLMLPHAGYLYCGQLIGETLANVHLPNTLIMLCPNHTGRGKPLGVWAEGAWATPLGLVPVNETIAKMLIEIDGGFVPDTASHLHEHSIEVLLPFLKTANAAINIVPVAVGTTNPAILKKAGHALAQTLTHNPGISVIVSSDMNHYEDHMTTLAKDELALAKACAGDATGLLEVTAREGISMCGAPALALALYAAQELGFSTNIITGHTTSGEASGDYDRTVGYAGMHLCK